MEYIIVCGSLLVVAVFLMVVCTSSNRCFFGHWWSRWGAPKEVKGVYYHFASKQQVPYAENVQTRECSRCGKVQECIVDKEEK